MKTIVVGAGEIGYHLSSRLCEEGHEVTVIEKDAQKAEHAQEHLNAQVVVGSGSSASDLEKANVRNANLFIAVTQEDEVNLLACFLAHQAGVEHTIARVMNFEYAQHPHKLHPDLLGVQVMVNPYAIVAQDLCEMVSHPDALDVAEFAQGKVVFLGYVLSEKAPVCGKSLAELAWTQKQPRVVVTSITRDQKTFVPKGEDKLLAKDEVFLVCKKKDLPQVRTLFALEEVSTKSIFILGAGRIGGQVARRLVSEYQSVKVIDRNRKHCQELASELEEVLVICTESTDIATLKNEGIEKADAFVGATYDDESNIFVCLLAKRFGVKRSIALVNEPELASLALSLGVDACVTPRNSTASTIFKYIRGKHIVSMVHQGNAEVLEIEIPPDSALVGKKIEDITWPEGVVIGSIDRGESIVIPGGKDELRSLDRVTVFSLLGSIQKVEKLFE